MPKSSIIRSIYFYAVSIISLFMIVFSVSSLINLGLKTWVFTQVDRPAQCVPGVGTVYPGSYAAPIAPDKIGTVNAPTGPTQAECDRQNKTSADQQISDREREAVQDFSLLVVALPLFLFHFKIVQKEWKEKREA